MLSLTFSPFGFSSYPKDAYTNLSDNIVSLSQEDASFPLSDFVCSSPFPPSTGGPGLQPVVEQHISMTRVQSEVYDPRAAAGVTYSHRSQVYI